MDLCVGRIMGRFGGWVIFILCSLKHCGHKNLGYLSTSVS